MLNTLQPTYSHTPILLNNTNIMASENNPRSKLKVLIVEDEPISQRVAQLMVEASGYEVEIAATGEAALELFIKNRYALILMDYGLPDLTGIQITRLIRKIEIERGTFTPIIAQTAHGSMAEQECISAGMNGLMSKPLIKDELDSYLNHWIKELK